MKSAQLHSDPRVVLFEGFLSREEAVELLALAQGKFGDSKVSCDQPGGCVSDYRTSSTAYLDRGGLADEISERGLRLAGLPFAEELQVVRYFPGQQFKPHLDAFDPGTPAGRKELLGYGGRQRDATFLIYLNDDLQGGETAFTKLGLSVKPVAGAALYWRNVGPSGRVDDRTMHAGMPVLSGVKYAVNLWARGRKALSGLGPRVGSSQPALRNFAVVPVRLGKIGEFPAAASSDRNVKVSREPYKGTADTLKKMADFIREGSLSPSMKQFAEMVIRQAGIPASQHLTNERAAQILLDYVRENVRYRPDPDNTELVQSPFITLCVPGASMCIPVEDCDGATVALGALMGAYGIPVRIMKQSFGENVADEHVLLIFQNDSGRWLGADATAPGKPIGWRAPAANEVIVDPLDPSGTGTQASDSITFAGVPERSRLIADSPLMPAWIAPFFSTPPPSGNPHMSVHDQAVTAQAVLGDLYELTSDAVNACSNLSDLQKSQWTDLAQRVVAFNSQDPDLVDLTQGVALEGELRAWSKALESIGCASSVPNVVYVPAPAIEAKDQPSDWSGAAKLGLWAVIIAAGAYSLKQVVEITKLGAAATGHVSGAAGEARRLVRRNRRRARRAA